MTVDHQINTIEIMAQGEQDAFDALIELIKSGCEINPENPGDMGFSGVLLLDGLEIYGEEIAVLWTIKCDQNVGRLIILLRGGFWGQLTFDKLKTFASDYQDDLHLTDYYFEELAEQITHSMNYSSV
jgi:hypothetical protein